jgi:hypothetical protein
MTGKKEDPLCSCPATKLIVSGTPQYFKHGKLGCCPGRVTHSEHALLTVNIKSQRKSIHVKVLLHCTLSIPTRSVTQKAFVEKIPCNDQPYIPE